MTYIMNSRRARDIYCDPGSKKKVHAFTNIVKMTILSKLICRFNEAPFKLQIYFTGLGEKQEFIWNPKRPQKAKEIPRSKSNAGGITGLKVSYRVIQPGTGVKININTSGIE